LKVFSSILLASWSRALLVSLQGFSAEEVFSIEGRLYPRDSVFLLADVQAESLHECR
jgi:hypothetical protein